MRRGIDVPASLSLAFVAGLITALAAGCGDRFGTAPQDVGADGSLRCDIPTDLIVDGGPARGGIPALSNPETAPPGGFGTGYLGDDDRVIGLNLGERTLAIPLNIMWWHEVVHLEISGRRIAVTHCPLTGSSLAFDRSPVDGAKFEVSGLLFMNNLILVPEDGSSLFPQMSRGGRCGPLRGTRLPMVPVMEMTWKGWRTLHPETEVVTSDTGSRRDYTVNPYEQYQRPNSFELLGGLPPIDRRLPPKERVLGIPAGNVGGLAVPFSELRKAGPLLARRVGIVRGGGVLFWSTDAEGGMTYHPRVRGLAEDDPNAGRTLTFEVRAGEIRDVETVSVWRLDGTAVEGPLAGAHLEPAAETHVAFWFAWSLFQPETEVLSL